MGGADVASSEHTPPRRIPHTGKVLEDGDKSASAKVRGVFREDKARPYLANDARVLAPEAATLSSEPGSCSGALDVLAGEPAADDVDVSSPRAPVERADIVPDGELGEETVSLASE